LERGAYRVVRGSVQEFVNHPKKAEHNRDTERLLQEPQRRRHASCSQAIVVRDAVGRKAPAKAPDHGRCEGGTGGAESREQPRDAHRRTR
jgi:hypothetical protein